MSEDFGNTIVTIEDEDGNEIQLEHVDSLEFEENEYMAFIPADTDEDAESVDFIILKVEEGDDGDDMLVTVDDDAELERVYEAFMKRMEAGEDGEEDDED